MPGQSEIQTNTGKMYKKILVALDGSEAAECVLPHVQTVLRGCDSPEVILVKCIESIAIPYGVATGNITSMDELMDYFLRGKLEAERYLNRIASHFRKGGIDTKTIVVFGQVSRALGELAAKNDVDLLVASTRRRSGIGRWLRGTGIESLIGLLDIPVLVLRSPEG